MEQLLNHDLIFLQKKITKRKDIQRAQYIKEELISNHRIGAILDLKNN